MQGISKTRHEHLIGALLQMERLLSRDCECLQEAEEYREELGSMYRDYECLLDELAKQIRAYELLSNQVKVQFLGKKLKALKKAMPVKTPDFPMLVNNIHLSFER